MSVMSKKKKEIRDGVEAATEITHPLLDELRGKSYAAASYRWTACMVAWLPGWYIRPRPTQEFCTA